MATSSLGSVGPGLLRRYIGRRFETLRRKAGLTQVEAAKRIDHARTTIVRIEDGHEGVRFREGDVQHMLDVYGANATERELLLTLTAETRYKGRGWWHDFTSEEMPNWFGLYVLLEDSAETIRQYHPALVPGLLQAEAYARLVFERAPGQATTQEVARRVEARMARQAVLARPRAPHLDVILEEAIIRRPMGDPATARAQLSHLITASNQTGIAIRVVPLTSGVHAGSVTNQFNLIRFPTDFAGDPVEPPLAYVETVTGAIYLHKPVEIAMYDRVWSDLEQEALDPDTSRALISKVMEGLADG